MGSKQIQRQMKAVLYSLQRVYGQKIHFVEVAVGTLNPDTGVVSETKTEHLVRRAITFSSVVRDLLRGVTTAGFGNFKVGDRLFIVLRRDLTVSSINESDYVVHNSKKWNIVEYHELDFEAGYVFHCRYRPGTASVTPTKELEDRFDA